MAGSSNTTELQGPAQLHGLLVVDKPPGPTSYDVIRFLRKTCTIPARWKVGHLGTLDPFASGVLVVALGRAVRYAEFALQLRKRYRARLWLGEETDTLDPSGSVVESVPVPPEWKSRLPEVAERFTGKLMQIPPAYSAKQSGGKRAYRAAREGEILKLEPAQVTVYSLVFGTAADQWVDFECEVSAGTYVRALGRDIARELGTVGHLVGLERLAVGQFTSETSIPFSAFEVGGMNVILHHLLPVDGLVEHLTPVIVSSRNDTLAKVSRGQELRAGRDFDPACLQQKTKPITVRLLDNSGRFVALGRAEPARGRIVPHKQWITEIE